MNTMCNKKVLILGYKMRNWRLDNKPENTYEVILNEIFLIGRSQDSTIDVNVC